MFTNTATMMRNYLKIALRNLFRQKTNTAINLLGLTVGITACLAIYTITSFELGYDRFHNDSRRIYRVVGQIKIGDNGTYGPIGFVPRAMPAALRQEISGFETVAAFHNMSTDVLIPNGSATPKRIEAPARGTGTAPVILADPQYFDIFQYQWLAGSPQTALAQPHTVVLTHNRAKLYFGDIPVQEMMGKTVVYRENISTTVTGIVQDWDELTDFSFTDFIASATIDASELRQEINQQEWNDIWSASQVFVKVAPETSTISIQTQLTAFGKRHFGPGTAAGQVDLKPELQPLSGVHFDEKYTDNYSRKAHLPTLYGLMGIAVFILLIAAVNFINMATAQSIRRAKATGIRKVLGSSRQHLILQMLGETFLTAVLATLLSVVFTPMVLKSAAVFLPEGVQFQPFRTDILLFLAAVAGITTLLSGLYPAWVLSAFQPAVTLKGPAALAGHQKGYLRKGLIVFQFTFSLIFIIGAVIIGRQLDYIRYKDLGFNTDAVVLIDTEHDEKSKVLADNIRQIPQVKQVTMQWFAPMGENYMVTKMSYRNGGAAQEIEVSAKVGDAQFIPMYELPVVAGRNYLPGDSLQELVINEAFVKAMGFNTPAEAIGALLRFNDKNYPVVGVVSDFHENSLRAAIKPVFIAHIPRMSRNLGVKLHTAGQQPEAITKALAQMEQEWAAVYPGKKFNYTFLDDSIASLYKKDRNTAYIVNAATAIAILISCLGLFGLVTFTAEQRTKEIGVRKVLGASVMSLIVLMTRDFVRLVIIALLLASPVAYWAMHHWLQDFVYHIDIQWWMFALAGLAAVVIAFLTVGARSINAAMVNPVESLRNE